MQLSRGNMEHHEQIADILSELNERKAKFVKFYLHNGANAKGAAIDAGYSQKSAGTQGPRLLKDPAIASAIKQIRRITSLEHSLTLEAMLKENRELMREAKKARQFNAVHRFHETAAKMQGHLVDKLHVESNVPLFSVNIEGIAPPRDVSPALEGKKDAEED